MTKSPLQLARDFARLQSHLSTCPAGDQRLLALLEFWPEIQEYSGDEAYQSYFDQYLPLLARMLDRAILADLTIVELKRLQQMLDESGNRSACGMVGRELAKMYFYVGGIEEGLHVLESPSPLAPLPEGEEKNESGADVVLESPSPLTPLPEGEGKNESGADAVSPSPLAPLPEGEGKNNAQTLTAVGNLVQGIEATNEYVAFQAVCVRATEINHPLAQALNEILTEWQGEREASYHDRAKCLFVERGEDGKNTRGRMRTLNGKVELFGKSAPTDEITFENAIKTPDDPFVGVAYDAFAAVRNIFSASGLRNQGSHYYHAHFNIEDSGQTFTGDSIGLAFGLLAYTQLLRPEALRLDRLVSGEVAFTGGVDRDGNLTAINDDTVPQKIERAFFSPVKYIVLPEASGLPSQAASGQTAHLKFPRRNLHLISARRIEDVVDDHNIIRSEKVCIGEFVAKRAAKYGKMTKVQVPLFLVLAYLLVCLIYPKAWVGFDWEPASVKFITNGFIVYNSNSHELWRKPMPFDPLGDDSLYGRAADLGGDGKNEVLVMPSVNRGCKQSGWLYVYDSKGDTLYSRDCTVRGEYPRYRGEKDRDSARYYVVLNIVRDTKRSTIIAQTYQDYPDRGAIRFLDGQGNYLGWYINAGGTNFRMPGDVNGDGMDEFIFFGYQQLLNCTAVFALSPDSSHGVSPPYEAPELDLRKVKRGNPVRYVMFFPTDVGRIMLRAGYNSLMNFFREADGTYRASVEEADTVPGGATVDYILDSRLRVLKVRLSDAFVNQRRNLIMAGKISDIPRTMYEDQLRDSVTYWTGTEYVTEGQLRSAGK